MFAMVYVKDWFSMKKKILIKKFVILYKNKIIKKI